MLLFKVKIISSRNILCLRALKVAEMIRMTGDDFDLLGEPLLEWKTIH